MNAVALTTTSYASQPLFVDLTGPSVGIVTDGKGEDVDFQDDATEICASWNGFEDSHSGISDYKVSIGTTPEAGDFLDFTGVGSYSDSICFKMTLQHGVTYYTTVVAIHGGADMINSTATSDGGEQQMRCI